MSGRPERVWVEYGIFVTAPVPDGPMTPDMYALSETLFFHIRRYALGPLESGNWVLEGNIFVDKTDTNGDSGISLGQFMEHNCIAMGLCSANVNLASTHFEAISLLIRKTGVSEHILFVYNFVVAVYKLTTQGYYQAAYDLCEKTYLASLNIHGQSHPLRHTAGILRLLDQKLLIDHLSRSIEVLLSTFTDYPGAANDLVLGMRLNAPHQLRHQSFNLDARCSR